jgi:hypothetical protein
VNIQGEIKSVQVRAQFSCKGVLPQYFTQSTRIEMDTIKEFEVSIKGGNIDILKLKKQIEDGIKRAVFTTMKVNGKIGINVSIDSAPMIHITLQDAPLTLQEIEEYLRDNLYFDVKEISFTF